MGKKAQVVATDAQQRQSHISVQRYFEISLLLMLTTGFLTVATTGKLDVVSIVVMSGALGIKLWSYIRGTDYSLGPKTVTRICIFYIFFYGLDFLIFSSGPSPIDRMLAATVHLMLFLAVMKIFSARTYLDYGLLATLSFLMMLASAVLTVGTTFLAFFTLYVVFAISTFISYEIKRGVEAAQRAPEGPFRMPEQNRRALEGALMKAAAGLAAGIFLLAGALFFVIPRYRTGYLTNLSMQAQNLTGFSETVNLGDIRKILRSPMVVMRVMPEGNLRSYVGVKWRGVSLNSFNGKRWFNDNTDRIAVEAESYQRFVVPPPDGWEHRPHHPLHYRVLRAALSTDVLFAAAEPRELTGIRLLSLDQTGSLHNPQNLSVPFAYEVVSDTGLPPAKELQDSSPNFPDEIRLVYLRLPNTLDPRVRELASTITASARNDYDRATAIQSYLRNNFQYTLDPPAIEPADPVGSFLLRSKSGYCEYFAAAMAVMLRTLKVPSRLVNGFQTGSYNRIGKDFVVRARDAHSWVEVYFTGYGWIPFDPTPADPHPVLPGEWDDYVDTAALFWNEWVINYDFSHQVLLAREIEQDSRNFQQVFRQRSDRLKRLGIRAAFRIEGWLMAHKLLVLVIMLGILAGLILTDKSGTLKELRFRLAWRFARRDSALEPRQATLTYQRLLSTLQKKGFRKKPSQTPREFAISFISTPWGPGVMEFTKLYNTLRYGQAAVSIARLRTILEEIAGRK
ncbi:MAG: transglutaminaseTgpA domain-containing protein [Acidobacteriota bacterium]|nr:transglutaminaseTgpA domain-containing protein [Acidobacteriota bacterium]